MQKIECREKKFIFLSNHQVLKQLHPQLTAHDEALYYVENLCLRLLTNLCTDTPHTIAVSFFFILFLSLSISLLNSTPSFLIILMQLMKNYFQQI
jgi:hypothetical protein